MIPYLNRALAYELLGDDAHRFIDDFYAGFSSHLLRKKYRIPMADYRRMTDKVDTEEDTDDYRG